jgi:hypothetical protein
LPNVTLPDRVHRLAPRPVPIEAEPALPEVSVVAETGAAGSDEAPFALEPGAPVLEAAPELTPPMLDVTAIEYRYPLLRNAL